MIGKPPAVDANLWEQRRHADPQGVIDALIGQAARQGRAIHELTAQVAQLEEELKRQQPPDIDPHTLV